MEGLVAHGNPWAIQIEQERTAANLASYDDLIRYAELILANDTVADLYQHHFGAIIVDEYQDLTPQQLRMLRLLGTDNLTFAGDLAQGIYGFAGAQPSEVDAAIRLSCDAVITFNENHRSSPAVLSVVNAMNVATGGEGLSCADPTAWPNGGLAGGVGFRNTDDESTWVAHAVQTILDNAPAHRVAVMSRIKSRLRFIDEHLTAVGVEVHRWEDGILDTDTAALVRSALARLNTQELATKQDKLTFLRALAGMDQVQESDTRRGLADALNWVLERLGDGYSPDEIENRIRIGSQTTLLTTPGIHLLSGHVGKGQQFDWVFILGAEDGNIPFFRAESEAELQEEARILGVMLSRARHGVVVTQSRVVPTLAGSGKVRQPSPFWSHITQVDLLDHAGIEEWIAEASWDALRDW